MSNSTISALTSATTPLAGTEVLPVNQSGTTNQVSVANLTAGRAVSAASLSLTSSPLPATSGGTGSSSAFTANGIAYANSTTTLNTGSALTFDGTKVDIISNTTYQLHLATGTGNYTNGGVYFGALGTSDPGYYGYIFYDQTTETLRLGNRSASSIGGVSFFIGTSGTPTEAAKVDSYGNYIPKIAGRGINFTANTPASGHTSQLLNWYEEGTWTPVASGTWTTTPTFYGTAKYTRVGRQVTLTFAFQNGVLSYNTAGYFTGLPFTPVDVGTGAVVDNNIVNRGLCEATGAGRIWVTNTSFPDVNFISITYFV